jgi:hypothetical protein
MVAVSKRARYTVPEIVEKRREREGCARVGNNVGEG